MTGQSSPAASAPCRRDALVISSDDGLRAFACQALDAFKPGFLVASARDPQQAAEWLQRISPVLVVMDARMAQALELFADWRRSRLRLLLLGSPPLGGAPADEGTQCVSLQPDLAAFLEAVRRMLLPQPAHDAMFIAAPTSNRPARSIKDERPLLASSAETER